MVSRHTQQLIFSVRNSGKLLSLGEQEQVERRQRLPIFKKPSHQDKDGHFGAEIT